jgi:DNA polymerase-3 subunit gamma/tau
MSGEVLYRKWRPPRFADIVGQGPVTQTLTQAIATDRTSHAYLLCGPRGTGKTSTARVLAKALNCTMRPEGAGDPCGQCPSCKAIEEGSFVDLIEIDAASNRGIDEMRDLREKVRFSPTQGKYKVYIIDEAHALTNDAFNAFLKTLEEPPPHSVFVLATTEPHRLPATIVSRCQRFDFRRIAPNDVVDRLTEIASSEGVNVSPEVLRTIARSSSGSLRDGTNLLDQLITAFGANVSIEQVRELLGIGGEDRAVALVKHLLTGNTTAALELINTVAAEGQDLRPLHRMTVDFLRAALLMKSGVHDSIELSKEAQAELSFATANTPMEHLLRALRMFGQITLKYDQPSPLPLELATVELGLAPVPAAAPAPVQQPVQQAGQQAPQQAPAPRPPAPPQAQAPAQNQNQGQAPNQGQPRPQQQPGNASPQPRPQQAPRPPRVVEPPAPIDPSLPVEERLVAQWPAILRSLSRVPRRRFDIAALLRSSSKREIEGKEVVVQFTHTSNSERLQDELDDARCRIEVEKVLSQALGEGFSLRIKTDGARKASNLNADQPGHLVRAAMSLGGQVIPTGTASPAPEPVADATPEPVAEAAPEPVADVTPEPVAEASPEPVAQATPEPVAQATPEPVAEATPEPVADVTPEPVAEAAPVSAANAAPVREVMVAPQPGIEFTREVIHDSEAEIAPGTDADDDDDQEFVADDSPEPASTEPFESAAGESLLRPFGAPQPVDPPASDEDAEQDPSAAPTPASTPMAEPVAVGAQVDPPVAQSTPAPPPVDRSMIVNMDPSTYPGPDEEDFDE